MSAKRYALGAVFGAVLMASTQFTAPKEGLRNVPYYDGAHVLTICRGHTPGVKLGEWLSDPECEKLFTADMVGELRFLQRVVKVELPIATWAALADFSLNVGHHAFLTSTALKRINTGDAKGGCDAIRFWNFITVNHIKFDCRKPNKLCGGLPVRREQERQQCLKDL